MVRPRILEDSKIISLVMERTDMEIVEKEKGNQSFSSYVRNLIRETQTGIGEKVNKENKLKKELQDTKAKLEVFERIDRATTQEHKVATQEISDSFIGYLSKYPNAGQRERDNWLNSRCKASCGVKPTEILSSLSLKS